MRRDICTALIITAETGETTQISISRNWLSQKRLSCSVCSVIWVKISESKYMWLNFFPLVVCTKCDSVGCKEKGLVSRYFSFCILLWNFKCTCHFFVKNFKGKMLDCCGTYPASFLLGQSLRACFNYHEAWDNTWKSFTIKTFDLSLIFVFHFMIQSTLICVILFDLHSSPGEADTFLGDKKIGTLWRLTF